MAPAKSKAQKMSIGTFLADESLGSAGLGSWADEMEDMPLPVPATTSGFDRRPVGGMGAGPGFERERGGYAVRDPIALPTHPPFTAHIGNLSFDATPADVSDLFAGFGVTNVRIVEDKLNKSPKGFGYVEFETVEGLKKALDFSGTTLQGRSIRISVAEPAKESRPDGKELDWTRRGPLPELPQRRAPDRTSFGRNLDASSDTGSERGGRRNFESDGKVRDFNNWERKGPLSHPSGPVRDGGRPRSNEGPGSGFRRNSPAWGEARSQDGSRPPRHDAPPERVPTAAEKDNQWRARMRPDQAPKEPSNPPSPAAAAPATRPKLNLQKRTISDAVSSPAAAAPSDSKSSPFGAARPIDTAAREREVEEKRQLAIRQKKEADEKAKAEKAEKQRLAKEQAKEEKASTAVDSNKDAVDTPHGGKNFEILRRAVEDEGGMTADHEAEEQKPTPAAAEAPEEVAANGNWRAGAAQAAEAGDDEGWSTVAAKPRNNRRGQAGRGFA